MQTLAEITTNVLKFESRTFRKTLNIHLAKPQNKIHTINATVVDLHNNENHALFYSTCSTFCFFNSLCCLFVRNSRFFKSICTNDRLIICKFAP